ncbi:MAG: hypothetical protein K2N72_02575 [Oscillospiraceae bacterium]|nr:hypothetical protein [Oscillospiraceae bacterium]
MPEWSELMQDKFFITDLGEERTEEIGGEQVTVGRYAVWSPAKNAKQHTIVEVGSDLGTLKEKYSVPDERICRLAE